MSQIEIEEEGVWKLPAASLEHVSIEKYLPDNEIPFVLILVLSFIYFVWLLLKFKTKHSAR
jgi:hypothetical protein